ncbi:MAG: hypothetical protein JW941_09325 [Candidatus Coatesbacteria bacterium]|nr:hypothetical protein [Candidatus Coatesbacteria bacterium]
MTDNIDSIFANRGMDGISQLEIRPAGDVGHEIEVELRNLSGTFSLGQELIVSLLSGQEIAFSIDALKAEKRGKIRATTLAGHDRLFDLSRVSPGREQIFATLSSGEHAEYARRTRDLTPQYDIHIRIGDQFGRRGWSSEEIARELTRQAGLDDVVPAIMPQWIRQVVCGRDVSFLEAILSLFRIQRPVLWIRDNLLFIMDTSLVRNFADGARMITNGLLAKRIVNGPPVPDGSSFLLNGGLGKFRPDRFHGKTWTASFNMSSALLKGDLEVRSSLLREMLSDCRCYGGYEFENKIERGESEVHQIKEIWLKDVIGRRQLLLFSQEKVYRTSQCANWSDDSACCNHGIRCNGRGTAVTCGWYQPRSGLDGDEKRLIRCEESLHIYESLSWDIETPRELASHSVISGSAWVRRKWVDSDGDARLVRLWLDPMEYHIRSFSYDPLTGTLEQQVTQKRAAVFSDSSECEFWMPGDFPGGACALGQGECNHFDKSSGECRLGLPCNEYGRIATCSEYTGAKKACPGNSGLSNEKPGYVSQCPDCTLRWRKVSCAKTPSDIPSDGIFRTSLIGKGSSKPDSIGDIVSPDGVDAECIVQQEIIRYEQVDANTYRRTSHNSRLVGGVFRASCESYNLPSSSVPSHPIELRKMRVSSEIGNSGGETKPVPRVERSDSNIVDWGDSDSVSRRAFENLSKAGVEDTYQVPGEFLLPAGMPILPPLDCGSELPWCPSRPGTIHSCEIRIASEPDGRGFSSTTLKVQY